MIGSLAALAAFLVGGNWGLEHVPPILGLHAMGSLPTDQETLALYTPSDEACQEIEQFIHDHPIAVQLRQDPDFVESRPHLKIPEQIRAHNLTAGTLSGPGKIVVPPYQWNQKDGKSFVSMFYVGDEMSGHPGIVHGGLLATMMDEGLARCCFPALPNKVAVTANLNVNYRQPTESGQYLVLRAKTTNVEGRKAYVEGHIETLPNGDEEPQVLVEATALFIEPRAAKVGIY